jgi:hypothetical protein
MTGRFAVLLILGLSGCAERAQNADVATELAAYVAQEIPEPAHRAFIDFGGKLQLVAYDLSPDGKAGPGQSVTAKLYWKPVSVISPGWGFFTHLEDARGRQLRNFDEAGPLRKWLSGKAPKGLSMLELGTMYVDEQTFEMPKAEELTPEVLLAVGVWNGDMRLPVVSGPSDGHHGGIVARIDTGLEWPKKMAAQRAGQEVRR